MLKAFGIGAVIGVVMTAVKCAIFKGAFFPDVLYLAGFVGLIAMSYAHDWKTGKTDRNYDLEGQFNATRYGTDKGTGTQIAMLEDVLKELKNGKGDLK